MSPEQAADKVVQAVVQQPVRIATRTGIVGELLQAVLPRAAQIVMHAAFRTFPDSSDATDTGAGTAAPPMSTEQVLMRQLLQGLHL